MTLKRCNIVCSDPDLVESNFALYRNLNTAISNARLLTSEPSNVLTPDEFVSRVHFLEELGVKINVLEINEILEQKMHLLAGVGIGSQYSPKLIVLEWNNGNNTPLALVGKGVTFDSGGISIKPSANMDEMKTDMAGAATVVGIIQAAALNQISVNLVGVLAIAENMPSSKALKPGDILSSMSGLTVEIKNTDAEGRLMLGDAITYVTKNFKPNILIDFATLTGAITVALGDVYAGLFCNNEQLSKYLISASIKTNQLLWRMPLHHNYKKRIESKCADIRNTSSKSGAGSSTAAHFLQKFIPKEVAWAHIDMAGTAYVDKKATGFGVELIFSILLEYENIKV